MRRSIGLMITSGLLPIIALGGGFGFLTLRAEHDAVRSGAELTARFSATLVATRLDDGMRSVNMITQSQMFDANFDRSAFRILALRLRDNESAWRSLSVADVTGHRLLDVPDTIGGEAGGLVIDKASFDRAIATRRPIVGDVVLGPRGSYAFAVRAPVVRQGQVRFVVSAIIPAPTVRPLVLFRQLPPGWRAAIVDGAGNLVVSSASSSPSIGKQVSLPGLQSRRTGQPSFYNFVRRDGVAAVGTWSPVPGTNWSVHVSAPASAYAAPARRAFALLLVVALISILLLALFITLLIKEFRQDHVRGLAEVDRQRLEALGRLTGSVAHDFNNLLTPIIGGLDLVRRRLNDEKSLRYVDAALVSADRARALVARLLSFARRQTLSANDLDLSDLFAGLRDILEKSLSPTMVEITVPEGLPPVRADKTQLEMAILNLAINARDAMPMDGVVRISVGMATSGLPAPLTATNYVAIAVADSGTGMDAATLNQAAEPFFTTKGQGRGTGLGLSMVQGFAAQSGGMLDLRSKVGEGTTATIYLPPGARTVESAARKADHQPPAGLRTILVVDDEAEVRMSLTELLRETGYEVVEAASVAEALEILTARAGIDAVITDYFMPQQTGADLIHAMYADHAGIPVMLVTGYADGAKDVDANIPRLAKPFTLSELFEKLTQLADDATQKKH